jgi:hypothetical protein
LEWGQPEKPVADNPVSQDLAMNDMTRLATFCGSRCKSICGPSSVKKPISGLTRRISLSQDADNSLSWEARKYITDRLVALGYSARLVGSDYSGRWADLDYLDGWGD